MTPDVALRIAEALERIAVRPVSRLSPIPCGQTWADAHSMDSGAGAARMAVAPQVVERRGQPPSGCSPAPESHLFLDAHARWEAAWDEWMERR